jgi:hypothetical protein
MPLFTAIEVNHNGTFRCAAEEEFASRKIEVGERERASSEPESRHTHDEALSGREMQ